MTKLPAPSQRRPRPPVCAKWTPAFQLKVRLAAETARMTLGEYIYLAVKERLEAEEEYAALLAREADLS